MELTNIIEKLVYRNGKLEIKYTMYGKHCGKGIYDKDALKLCHLADVVRKPLYAVKIKDGFIGTRKGSDVKFSSICPYIEMAENVNKLVDHIKSTDKLKREVMISGANSSTKPVELSLIGNSTIAVAINKNKSEKEVIQELKRFIGYNEDKLFEEYYSNNLDKTMKINGHRFLILEGADTLHLYGEGKYIKIYDKVLQFLNETVPKLKNKEKFNSIGYMRGKKLHLKVENSIDATIIGLLRKADFVKLNSLDIEGSKHLTRKEVQINGTTLLVYRISNDFVIPIDKRTGKLPSDEVISKISNNFRKLSILD